MQALKKLSNHNNVHNSITFFNSCKKFHCIVNVYNTKKMNQKLVQVMMVMKQVYEQISTSSLNKVPTLAVISKYVNLAISATFRADKI